MVLILQEQRKKNRKSTTMYKKCSSPHGGEHQKLKIISDLNTYDIES